MLPGGLQAIVGGAVLGLVALLGTVVPRLRRHAPEALLGTALILALLLVDSPLTETGNSLWRAALMRPTAVSLVLLALIASRAGIGPSNPGPIEALCSGFLLGGLPAVALLVPGAKSPRDAARVTLMASAASAASPIGGPVQALMVQDPLGWLLYAAPPALAAALIASPGPDLPRAPELSPRLLISGALGLAGAVLHTPMSGLTLFALALLILVRPPLERAPGLSGAWPLRMALAAVGVGSAATLLGVPWFAAEGLSQLGLLTAPFTTTLALAAAGAGLLVDPMVLATLLERTTAHLDRPTALFPALLPLALAPAGPLVLAALAHGAKVLRYGLPIALVQLAIALAWIAGTS